MPARMRMRINSRPPPSGLSLHTQDKHQRPVVACHADMSYRLRSLFRVVQRSRGCRTMARPIHAEFRLTAQDTEPSGTD